MDEAAIAAEKISNQGITHSTLKDFGLNPKNLGADIGMTAVLHTHNRRLDFHPHIHVLVPGGGVDKAKKYLSRYLYRGVIGENNIVSNQDGKITFKYVEARTGKTRYRKINGEAFLCRHLYYIDPPFYGLPAG